MPRRRRSALTDDGAVLRAALYTACIAVDDVLRGWIGDDELADPLRFALLAMLRDGRSAIVLLDERDRDAPVVAARRSSTLHAALRVNAALASAYQDRAGAPRTILAACHAVARVIELLHAAMPADAVPRWN